MSSRCLEEALYEMAGPAELFDLSGKAVLVTGGGRGLGRAIVQGCAEAGADVIIASRNLEACEQAARAVQESTGRSAHARRLHVGHWDEIADFATDAWGLFGKIDVLVNNAGMSPLYDDVRNVTEDYWDKVIGVNLKGPFKLCAEIGSRMAEAGGGSIINISTLASLGPTSDTIPYGAAKAGLNAMGIGFARTWPRRVRVNTIVPGAFRTDVTRHWPSIPKGIGEPDEIVGAAIYLASDASSYTTGAEIRVAGHA